MLRLATGRDVEPCFGWPTEVTSYFSCVIHGFCLVCEILLEEFVSKSSGTDRHAKDRRSSIQLAPPLGPSPLRMRRRHWCEGSGNILSSVFRFPFAQNLPTFQSVDSISNDSNLLPDSATFLFDQPQNWLNSRIQFFQRLHNLCLGIPLWIYPKMLSAPGAGPRLQIVWTEENSLEQGISRLIQREQLQHPAQLRDSLLQSLCCPG